MVFPSSSSSYRRGGLVVQYQRSLRRCCCDPNVSSLLLFQKRRTKEQQQQQQQRNFASSSSSSSFFGDSENDDLKPRTCRILALGENWTGAFGTGRLEQFVSGHYDEFSDTAAANKDASIIPSVFEGHLSSMEDLPSVSAGWGHSAITAGDSLVMAGQPHDWGKLLRYKRMPPYLAKLATKFESMKSNVFGTSLSKLMERYSRTEQHVEQSTLPMNQQKRHSLSTEPQKFDLTRREWHIPEQYTFLHTWTDIPLPEPPQQVKCSAGWSAVLGMSGRLYCFGQNHWGQCGTGIITQSNIWLPHYPTVKAILDDVPDDFHLLLSSGMKNHDKINNNLPQVLPVDPETFNEEEPYQVLYLKDFALGLQHGIGLDHAGRVYCWGKGKRGQLGQMTIWDDSCAALRVSQYFTLNNNHKFHHVDTRPSYHSLEPVVQVQAGMLHCAALSVYNQVYIWGKHVLPPLHNDAERGKRASDSKIPYQIPRHSLPDCDIVQLACGSHHTSMLFEDGSVYAVGISTDTSRPLVSHPVQLIPPGVLEYPIRQFTAHMDRTTVVAGNNNQVIQAHLWEEPHNQAQAMFTPTWVDRIEPGTRIEQIHRSWVHTLIVVTSEDEKDDNTTKTKAANTTAAAAATTTSSDSDTRP